MTARARSALGAVVLGLAAVAAWTPVQAQSPTGGVARIGYLHIGLITPEPSPERRAFLEGLRALGYEVERNLKMEYRGAAMRPYASPPDRSRPTAAVTGARRAAPGRPDT